tara:strand:+ start:251 stop:415 length:165 start_codon:yes stop_codon:yes gene_type:complete
MYKNEIKAIENHLIALLSIAPNPGIRVKSVKSPRYNSSIFLILKISCIKFIFYK